MTTIILYKGISELSPVATGAGGALLIANDKALADRSGPVFANASSPTVNDDAEGSAGNGKFYLWSKWLNTVSNRVFFCVDSASGTAHWVDITATLQDEATPKLGANLGLNGYDINGTGNISISGNITGTNLAISNWNSAYGWGNHASAGYAPSGSLGTAAYAGTGSFATATQGSHGETAYGWGNHASAGYVLSVSLGTAAYAGTGSFATATQGSHADTAYGWGNPSGVYSPITHDHSGVYSLTSHAHSGIYSPVAHNHSGIYEPVLGNPGVTGYVLTSTSAGVRSWTAVNWTPSGGNLYYPTGYVGIGTSLPVSSLHVKSGLGAGVLSSPTPDANGIIIESNPAGTLNSPAQLLFYAKDTAVNDRPTFGASRIISGWGSAAWNSGYIHIQTHGLNSALWTDDICIVGGNVGVGTAIPYSKLELNLGSSGGFHYLRNTGANEWGIHLVAAHATSPVAGFTANGNTGEVRIGGLSANYFPTFYSNGSEVVRILTNGNVGIGTTAPQAPLQVAKGVAGVAEILRLTNTDATTNTNKRSVLSFTGLDSIGGEKFGASIEMLPVSYNISGAILVFKTSPANSYALTALVEAMRITEAGKVGIGTASPTVLLDVSGAVDDNTTTDLIRISNTAYSASGRAGMGFYQSYGASSMTSAQISSSPGGNFLESKLFFSVANSAGVLQDRIVIDVSGNVGIGVSTPDVALHIKGSMKLAGSSSGYVGFAPAAAAGSTVYTLPAADGSEDQALRTDGGNTLSWVSYLKLNQSTPQTLSASPYCAWLTTLGDMVYAGSNKELVRLQIGAVGTVLIGGTTPAWGLIDETYLNFTNIATANASAAKHGLAPKLSGNPDTYLDGEGNWTVPPGTEVGANQPQAYKAVNDNYTTLVTDKIIECTVAGKTITLLTAVGNTGLEFTIDNSSTGNITVDGDGAEHIQGEDTQIIPSQSSMTVYSNGAGWRII